MSKTKPFRKQLLEMIIEIWTRILCDTRPTKIEAIYIFANTKDNQTSVLDAGARSWHTNKKAVVLVCDGTTAHGYPGYKVWQKYLVKKGVLIKSIIPIKVKQDVDTLTEARALAMFIESSGIKNIAITSMPFHQIRAFITIVSVFKKTNKKVKIYNIVADSLDWREVVSHSQGVLKNTRSGLIKDEIDRIEKYQAKGDLVSFATIKKYLNSRD